MFSDKSLIDKISISLLTVQFLLAVLTIWASFGKIPVGILPSESYI